MAHFVSIGGEAHKISGGYANIGGEAHEILCGHANIGGECCDIKFEVTWQKYNCVRDEYEYYSLVGPNAVASGVDASKSFTGYESYEYDDENGIVYGTGDQKTADINHTSVFVYIIIDDRTVHECWVLSDGRWVIREWYVGLHSAVEYYIRTSVGTVLAPDGEYPDENLGYTYVEVYDGYTIMKDPDGNYYAYKEEY